MPSKPAKSNDFCRVCSAEFHIKYGIPDSKREYRLSTENLFRPSQRKECFGVILGDECRSVGITVDESKTYSDRVCNPCARKIRNLGNLNQSIQSAFKLSESSESKENRTPSSPRGVLPKKMCRGVRSTSQTLTLFMTKICDFSCPIYDLNKNLIPYL